MLCSSAGSVHLVPSRASADMPSAPTRPLHQLALCNRTLDEHTLFLGSQYSVFSLSTQGPIQPKPILDQIVIAYNGISDNRAQASLIVEQSD